MLTHFCTASGSQVHKDNHFEIQQYISSEMNNKKKNLASAAKIKQASPPFQDHPE